MRQHLEFDIELKENSYSGKFIVVEGIDGAGKTTQVADIVKHLSKKHKVHANKQPSDGPIGKLIRKVLAGKPYVPQVAFQYLFSADREAQQQEIIDHLKKGEIVVMDRYVWSALAYGILDHGFEKLEETGNILLAALSILSMYHRFLLPDLTIYLDVPVKVSVGRLRRSKRHGIELYKRGKKIQKAKQSYEWILKTFPKEFFSVNGNQAEDRITKEIISHIEPLLEK